MDAFKLPRSTLDKLPTATLKGVMVALLELADENGCVLISIRELAKSIGLNYQPLRTALKFIYANAIANAISTQGLTQITICNIEDYCVSPRRRQRNVNAAVNAITGPQKTQKFIPPTDAEVKDHVLEMGYHFNPESFVPHYQSKGWKVGKEPMKDWRAACRTWEAAWKQKHGNQFYYQINGTAKPANDYTGRAESRRRMSSLASEILSRDADAILCLYDGEKQETDNCHYKE